MAEVTEEDTLTTSSFNDLKAPAATGEQESVIDTATSFDELGGTEKKEEEEAGTFMELTPDTDTAEDVTTASSFSDLAGGPISRQFSEDSEPVQRARKVKEEDESGDLFGLIDNKDIPKWLSAFSSAGEGFSELITNLPKTIAAGVDIMGGGQMRAEFKEAAKLAEQKDIPFEKAHRQVIEEQGFFEQLTGGGPDPAIKESPLFKTSKVLNDAAEELFPENPETKDEFLSRQVPKMAGRLAGFFAGGALTKGANRAVTLSTLGSVNNSVQQFKQAKEQGASNEEAFDAFALGMATGPLEAVPVAAGLKRIDRFTGGAVKKALGRAGVNTIQGVFEEGVQEGLTQTISNLGAKEIYDKTRNLLDGVGTAMAIGGALGGTANAIGAGLKAKMAEAETTQEAAEVAETQSYLKMKLEQEGGSLEEVDSDIFDTSPAAQDLRQPEPEEISPDNQTYVVPERSTWEKFSQGFKNWFSKRGQGKGVLPKSAQQLLEKKKGRIGRELVELNNNVKNLEQTLKKEFGIEESTAAGRFFSSTRSQEIPDEVYEKINWALSGERPSSPRPEGTREMVDEIPSDQVPEADLPFETRLRQLPKNLQKPVRRMREHVDRLSRRLIVEGVAQGDLEMKIKKNIGSYLTRTYKRDDYEDWENFLFQSEDGTRIINNAKAYIIKSYKDTHDVDPRDPDNDFTEPNQLVKEILNNDQDPFELFQGQGDNPAEGIDWDVLKKREAIAEPIRALMGQRKDGVLNYARSIQKMANLLESHRYQREFRDVGLSQGWLHPPDEFHPGAEKIVPDNTKVYEPLTDDQGRAFQADKEVADAFKQGVDFTRDNKIGEWFARVNGFAKIAKTAYNQGTHLDNTIGAALGYVSNGHLTGGGSLREAANIVRQNLTGGGVEDPAMLQKATELNLIGGGGISGELKDLARDISGDIQGDVVDELTIKAGRARSHLHGLSRQAKMTSDRILDIYQASDDFFRLSLWRAEARQYAKAMHDKPLKELSGKELDNVEQQAADIAKAQFQDYSSVPKIVKEARKLPFTNFLSFQYEMGRTSINTAKRAWQEINSSNPKIRKIGLKRLAGLTTAYSGALFKGAAKLGAAMAGISLSADAMKDVREHAAPWDRNGILMPVKKEERPQLGPKYTFYNLSQHDPYSILNGPIRAILRGDDFESAKRQFVRAGREQLDPLFSNALVAQGFVDILRNETPFGAKVYHEGASDGEKFGQMMWHLYEKLEPGFVQGGREAVEATTNLNAVDGEVGPADALLGNLGIRATEIDPEKSLTFAIDDLQQEIKSQRSEFAGTRASGDFDKIIEEAKESNRQYEQTFNEVSRKVWSAYRLGVPLKTIRAKLDEQNISQDVADQVLRGYPGQLIDSKDLSPDEE